MNIYKIAKYDRYNKHLKVESLINASVIESDNVDGYYFKDYIITFTDKRLRNKFVIDEDTLDEFDLDRIMLFFLVNDVTNIFIEGK